MLLYSLSNSLLYLRVHPTQMQDSKISVRMRSTYHRFEDRIKEAQLSSYLKGQRFIAYMHGI